MPSQEGTLPPVRVFPNRIDSNPLSWQVRCSGDRNGCAKCSALGIRCIFPASSERGTQGKKRARVIQEKRNADDHSTNPDTGSRLVSATDTRDGSIGPDTGAECLPGQTRPSPSDEANSTSALAVKSPQQPASSRCSAVFGTGTNTLAPSLFTDIGFMGNDFLDCKFPCYIVWSRKSFGHGQH